MKRSVILILTLILLISMVSCARKSVDKKDDINDTKNNESNRDIMAESNSELNVIENGNDQERLEDVKFYPEGAELDFTTISYFSWNGDGIFKVPHLSDLGVQEYLDNRVVPTVDIDFFGRVYTFEYETTANLSTSNYTVHVYKLPESHTTKIMVNAFSISLMVAIIVALFLGMFLYQKIVQWALVKFNLEDKLDPLFGKKYKKAPKKDSDNQ